MESHIPNGNTQLKMSERAASSLGKVIYPLCKVLGYIGAGVVAPMIILVVVDVFLRYVFNKPIFGSYEIVGYMLAVFIAFSIPFAGAIRAHIAIDALTIRMPQKVRIKIQTVIYSLCLITLGLVAWLSFAHSVKLWQVGQSGQLLPVPFAPFMILLSIGFTLLFFVVLVQMLHHLAGVVGEGEYGTN